MGYKKLPQRWVARPVEIQALEWTGDADDLPDAWVLHPNLRMDGHGLLITTIEGEVGRPQVGDYIVWGTAAEFYWVPPHIFHRRHTHVEGMRWTASAVETEAAQWTGDFTDLPDAWQADPHFDKDAAGLAITNYRGVVVHPRVGDYIVQRNGGKFSWVPRAIFEFKYEQVSK